MGNEVRSNNVNTDGEERLSAEQLNQQMKEFATNEKPWSNFISNKPSPSQCRIWWDW